jgi:hypothetical protein
MNKTEWPAAPQAGEGSSAGEGRAAGESPIDAVKQQTGEGPTQIPLTAGDSPAEGPTAKEGPASEGDNPTAAGDSPAEGPPAAEEGPTQTPVAGDSPAKGPTAEEGPAAAVKPPSGRDALSFAAADKALILGMAACGFFFWEWLFTAGSALGVSLFTLLICGVTLPYLRKCGIRQSRESMVCLVVLGLSCIRFALFDTTDLSFFNFVFTALLYLYWISVVSGTRLTDRISGYIAFEAASQCVIIPFGNIDAIFLCFRRSLREMRRGREFIAAALGLLVFLPLFAIVLSLLIEADDAFGSFWRAFLSHFPLSQCVEYLIEFVIGIPVAAYLYGAVFGNARRRRTDALNAEELSKVRAQIRFAPSMAFCAPLFAFNAIYVLFFIALGNYFFSAFTGELPEAVTYAEYARKGFFELCWVATVNLLILACVYLLLRKRDGARPRALRVMTGFMSAFTLLLVATAMSKMLLYIESYGLTRLRVYTTWFMLLLIIVFLLLLFWHFRAFNLAKPLLIAAVLCFIALGFANTDGLIAKHNIDRYLSGRDTALDVPALASLSDAAAPHLYAAWEREKGLLQDPGLNPGHGATRDKTSYYTADAVSDAAADVAPGAFSAREEGDDPSSAARTAADIASLTARVHSLMLKEENPRIRTALALGCALLSGGLPPERQSFAEWNLESHRAAALSGEVFRELSAAVEP